MVKKVLFVIAQSDFRDEELNQPKEVLDRRKIEVKIASKTRHKAMGKLGTEIEPDLSLAEVKVSDFDALVMVGGSGAADYLEDNEVLDLIKEFKSAGKILGAICLAPSILANAGALIGKNVTSFSTEEQSLRDKGAKYTGMQVEIDGKVITAKDPSAAVEFGEKLAYLLEE